jgi:hypothetical protein
MRLIEQNEQMVELLKQYDVSLIENQVLHQELENMRNQTTKKENELRKLCQKYSESKVK